MPYNIGQDKVNDYSLAVSNDGTAWAWGWNGEYQLGDGSYNDRYIPTRVKGPKGKGYLTGITALAAGNGYNLALKNDGTVWAWGWNGDGRLGNGKSSYSYNGNYYSTPVQVKGPEGIGFLTDVKAIAAGDLHSLALKRDGTVWAWGDNNHFPLGEYYGQRLHHVPVQGLRGKEFRAGITAIAAGFYFSMALMKDGTVWAWGLNGNGQLGYTPKLKNLDESRLPMQVNGLGGSGILTGITAIAAGQGHSMALRNDGTVFAWGWNGNGQLGDGSKTDRHTPVQVRGPGDEGYLTGVIAIATRPAHTLALKKDGTVWAWGDNEWGQLGDGTQTERLTPVQVKGPAGSGFLTGVTDIEAGEGHSLAFRSDGTVWAWGHNNHGQLGIGSFDYYPHPTPVQVKMPGPGPWSSGANR
ncbi:MAG: hypothetical protein M1269_04130 [Chloroflexi bacterium]|nr:hypothetical protein [Chloroflexota bacterium]